MMQLSHTQLKFLWAIKTVAQGVTKSFSSSREKQICQAYGGLQFSCYLNSAISCYRLIGRDLDTLLQRWRLAGRVD